MTAPCHCHSFPAHIMWGGHHVCAEVARAIGERDKVLAEIVERANEALAYTTMRHGDEWANGLSEIRTLAQSIRDRKQANE